MAGSTYDRFEFWPGPLNEDGTLPDPDDCSAFDRIWVVDAYDLELYDETGVATTDLAEWPVHLGAEVIDGDGFPNNYVLERGDRPRVYGSQTAFWVMNDVGNEHRKTLTDPIGLEAQVTAFSVVSEEEALDQATFYRYRLVNRNSEPFEDAYFAFFQDPDLGDATDDLVGVDTTRGLAFTYNDGPDGVYGVGPAFGVDFLDGPGSSRWLSDGVPTPISSPRTALQHYHAMQGRWNDGTPFTEGGVGYETEGDTTVWHYPGDPVTGAFWSEISENNPPGDRHYLISSPSFSLAPGESKDVHLALVFAQGADHLDSITELRAASDRVQAVYDEGTLFPVASGEGASAPSPTRLDAVYPNPVQSSATVMYRLEQTGPVRLAAYDVLGRQVAVLAEGPQVAGEHRAVFEAGSLASGVYLVVLEANGERQTQKVMLVR